MFEDWENGQPDNFSPGEDCTHIRKFTNLDGRWNDEQCSSTGVFGDVLRPLCKQERKVLDHPYITSS